jgi:hypothetical protein
MQQDYPANGSDRAIASAAETGIQMIVVTL